MQYNCSNTIKFNNTIDTYLINQSATPTPGRTTSNYSNIDITFKDIKFVIGSTSSITHFISTDLRTDRNGIQMVLDNVIFIF
ncbi:hypothetical protein [Flavobacterium sp. HJSW_4]|uniref:hypothetical protein n=1 Tax=Flavobacterium sp. HJSW_4 TaxID=3344660 RepID=UPI0035F4F574